MIDPVSLVTMILSVVQRIGDAVSTVYQNKEKCKDLAQRASNLGDALPHFAMGAGNNMATVRGLERLRDTLDEAFKLITYCQQKRILATIFSSDKATELDNVDRKITNCLTDINFFSLAARGQHMITAAGSVPAPTYYDYNYNPYYQAQGGPSSAYVGFPTPQLNAPWIPGPPAYAVPPAPSGYDLSSLFTLPTVNKIIHHVFR
jgi:hypothetical protein